MEDTKELSQEENQVIDAATDLAKKIATPFLRDLTLFLANNVKIEHGYYLTQVGIDVAITKFAEFLILYGAAFSTDPEDALEKHLRVLKSIFDSNLFGDAAVSSLKESLKDVKGVVEMAQRDLIQFVSAGDVLH